MREPYHLQDAAAASRTVVRTVWLVGAAFLAEARFASGLYGKGHWCDGVII